MPQKEALGISKDIAWEEWPLTMAGVKISQDIAYFIKFVNGHAD